MIHKNLSLSFTRSNWKLKKIVEIIVIVFIGLIITYLGYSINYFYDVFFSICLGLLIGGIIMSIISTFLAEMSTHDLQGVEQLDHVDHVDHIDHIDHIDHPDHIDHIDHVDHIDHIDHPDHIDHIDHVDHIDHPDHVDHIDHPDHIDHIDHTDNFNDSTPAPFMLLFSTSLLFFGILGIIFYYTFTLELRFLIIFATIAVTYIITKLISISWKKMAKSRFYNISSTKNLIGVKGEVVLDVDSRGGIIKIISATPMKFEKLHVKPLKSDSYFREGEKVYICDVSDGFLLVDNKIKSIRYMGG